MTTPNKQYNEIIQLEEYIAHLEEELERFFKLGEFTEADLIAEELYVTRKELKTKEEELYG